MTESSTAKQLDILIVEDNPADVQMAREALRVAEIPHRLHVADNGEDALLFLLREGRYAGAPRPDVVLLDLRLPRANGFGLLAAIRANRRLKGLTVVILTGSSLKYDEAQSGVAGADHFITKPVGLDAYVEAMRRIKGLATPA